MSNPLTYKPGMIDRLLWVIEEKGPAEAAKWTHSLSEDELSRLVIEALEDQEAYINLISQAAGKWANGQPTAMTMRQLESKIEAGIVAPQAEPHPWAEPHNITTVEQGGQLKNVMIAHPDWGAL